jgi:hypothetical protein
VVRGGAIVVVEVVVGVVVVVEIVVVGVDFVKIDDLRVVNLVDGTERNVVDVVVNLVVSGVLRTRFIPTRT